MRKYKCGDKTVEANVGDIIIRYRALGKINIKIGSISNRFYQDDYINFKKIFYFEEFSGRISDGVGGGLDLDFTYDLEFFRLFKLRRLKH